MRSILLSLVFVLGAHGTAAAQSVPFTFVREPGAEACADEVRVARSVARLLARHGDASSIARHVRGNVASEDSGFVASLALEENGVHIGVRVLRAARCDALFDQIVFITYLLLSSPAPEVDAARAPETAAEEATVADEQSPVAAPEAEVTAPVPDEAPRDASEDAPAEVEDRAAAITDDDPPPILSRDDAQGEDVPPPDRVRTRFPQTRPFYVHAGGAATYGMVPGFWPGVTTGFGIARPRFAFESNFAFVTGHEQALTADSTVRRWVFAVETQTCAQTKRRVRVRFIACLALGLSTSFASLVEATGSGDLTVSPYAGPTLALNVALMTRLSVSLYAGFPFRLVLHGWTIRDGVGTQHVLRDQLVTATLGVSVRAEFGRAR